MNNRKIPFLIGGAILLLLAILVGAFFAGPLIASANSNQATNATAGTPNKYCEQYLQDLANRLHVSVDTLQQDKKAAHIDVLAQLVKDGKLTQAQADKIKARIESHQPCTGKHDGKSGQNAQMHMLLQKYGMGVATDVAQGLHLSVDQLKAQLQSGKSLSTIATAQHVSADQLHTIVTNAIQSALSKAISAGDLTQAQASSFTTMLQQHPQLLDKILNGHIGKKLNQ